MIDVPVKPLQLRAGPVEVDSNRLPQEAGAMALVLIFVLAIRLIFRATR